MSRSEPAFGVGLDRNDDACGYAGQQARPSAKVGSLGIEAQPGPTVRVIEVSKIVSHWYDDVLTEWRPDDRHIGKTVEELLSGGDTAPILVVKKGDRFEVVDGHHRLFAHLKAGATEMKAIVLDGTFEDTEDLRTADRHLKAFDEATGYRYRFSDSLKTWTKGLDGDSGTKVKRRNILGVMASALVGKAWSRLVRIAFR